MADYESQAYLKIKSWSEDDRPREKLLKQGIDKLSNAELLAILIHSGTQNLSAVAVGQLLLNEANNSLEELAKFSIPRMKKLKGIGNAKAISIAAAMELGRRRKKAGIPKRVKVTDSQKAFQYIAPSLYDQDYEHFYVLLLNRANFIMKEKAVSEGGVSGTVVDAKAVFKLALEELASGIILCHNHPSGNIQPSEADIKLTKKLKNGGDFLDIKVLDHLIISNENYFSFADEGLI